MRYPTDFSPCVGIMWESFGPTHYDRLCALAGAGFEVDAIELSSVSRDYIWERSRSDRYHVWTLDGRPGGPTGFSLFRKLLSACLRSKAKDFFFCHYERAMVFFCAIVLRLLGRRVFTMMDSKFDDYPRSIGREYIKRIFLMPYNGAIVASDRARDYIAFLGVPRTKIALGYDTIDVERIRAAAALGAGSRIAYADRPFLVVARLVPKKNIVSVLEAFALYVHRTGDRRKLRIIGYGPEHEQLARRAAEIDTYGLVEFSGRKANDEVAIEMARAVALILASTEEQFGLVVNEALAVGLPVILSSNAGAVDVLLQNLGNGVVINPHDIESIVLAMLYLATDKIRWHQISENARLTSARGHVSHFVQGVQCLLERS